MSASSSGSAMSVFLTTFNMNMRSATLSDDELRKWVAPAFEGEQTGPDLVVVGVQELLPLEVALAGWAQSALTTLSNRLHLVLSSLSTSSPYSLLASHNLGGVALMIFTPDDAAARIRLSVKASLALGDAGLSNKAAVGVRLVLNRDDEGGEAAWESFTFISAHLSAHDYNLPRRNAELASIASSLLFPPSSPLDAPLGIFDSTHTFLMGDLNYRLLKTPPMGHALSASLLDSPAGEAGADSALRDERSVLLSLDTLRQEQEKGTALTGWKEGDLSRFAPTYKRVIGQRAGWSSKRIPGYTDRVLWLSATEPSEGINSTGKGLQWQAYESIEEITLSDHKPVVCRVAIPRVASPSGSRSASSPHHTPRLTAPAGLPSRADATLLAASRAWGLAADRTLGYAWLLALLLGGGKLYIGIAVEAVLLLGVVGYASGWLRI